MSSVHIAQRPDDGPALSWLDLVPTRDPPEVETILAETLARSGFIRNSQRVFAHHPQLFLAYTAYGDTVMDATSSPLTERERELVALVVSSTNRCTVCIFSHASELRRITGDPVWVEAVALNHHHAALSYRERALAGYAVKLTLSPAEVSQADIEPLRFAGLKDETVLELAHLVAYYNLSNRLMTGLGVRPTDEAYFAHRG